jgi:hypothetical protein
MTDENRLTNRFLSRGPDELFAVLAPRPYAGAAPARLFTVLVNWTSDSRRAVILRMGGACALADVSIWMRTHLMEGCRPISRLHEEIKHVMGSAMCSESLEFVVLCRGDLPEWAQLLRKIAKGEPTWRTPMASGPSL